MSTNHPMPRRRALLAALAAVLLPLAAAPAARADFFSGDVVDGPDGGIRSVGDVDVARDGSGAVTYVKQDGGVDHVFVSRLVNGVWQTPERVDAGLNGPGSQPVVAASDGGRVIVAYVNDGVLYDAVRPDGKTGFAAPQALATGASDPSIDMSINGGAYISFTLVPGDVRVARVDRKELSFHVLDQPLDIDPGRAAGLGNDRSRVAVSADGTAVVVWGEGGHVYARRIFFDKVSVDPQDLNVGQIDGVAGAEADLPAIDIEDDASFAWVVFRERLADNRFHVIAKRLVGSEFEDDTLVDGISVGSGDSATLPFIDISGRGEGISLTSTAFGGVGAAVLHDDHFFEPGILNTGNAVPPHAAGAADENNDLYAFWIQGTSPADSILQGTSWDIDPAKRTVPAPGGARVLSDIAAGAVDGNAGLDAAVNRAGDAVAVYVQDGPAGRRLMSSGFDRPPGSFRTYTTSHKYGSYSRTPLKWSPAFELWGPPTYTVQVDGKAYGQTQDTKILIPATAPIPDGTHKWRVVATDRRGQTSATAIRTLRVDGTRPAASVKVARHGRRVRVSVRAADGSLSSPHGSGVRVVRISFGDGAKVQATKASHTYRKGGAHRVTVTVADRAGNITVVHKRVGG